MPVQHPTRFMLSEWLSIEVIVDNGEVTATFVERQNPASLNDRCILNIVTTELSRPPTITGHRVEALGDYTSKEVPHE